MHVRHEYIAELRQRKFLTQAELAEKVNVGRVTIARIETGATTPRPSTIRAIAAALDVSPEQLVTWEDDQSPKTARAA